MESSHDEHVLETNGVPRIPCASILVRISLAPNNKESCKENKIKSYDLNEYDNTRCEPISKTDLAFQSSYLYELHQQQKTLNDKKEKKEKKENEMKQNKLTSLYNTQLISIYNAVSLAFLSNSKAAIIHQPKPIENEQNPNKISTYAQKWLDSLLPSCHIIKLNDLLDYSFVSPYNKEGGIAININQLYNMPNQKKKTVFNAFSLSPHKNTVYKVIYSIYPGSSFYDNSNDNNSNYNNNNNDNNSVFNKNSSSTNNDSTNNIFGSTNNKKNNLSNYNIFNRNNVNSKNNNNFNKTNNNDDSNNSNNGNNNDNSNSSDDNNNNNNNKNHRNILTPWGVKFTQDVDLNSNIRAPLFTDAPQLFYPKNMNLIYNDIKTNMNNDIFLIIDVRSITINNDIITKDDNNKISVNININHKDSNTNDHKNNHSNSNSNSNSNKDTNKNNNDIKSYWALLPLSKDSREPETGNRKSNRYVNSGTFQLPLFEGNFPYNFVTKIGKSSLSERERERNGSSSVLDRILKRMEEAQEGSNDELGKYLCIFVRVCVCVKGR